MEEQRSWDKLIPEVLGLIFCRLSLEVLLTIVPSVCKSWENFVKGPYCWKEIDIEEWCDRSTPYKIDKMVRMLVNRSGGCMRKFAASKLSGDPIISFIADNAASLQTLRLTRCEMSDEVIILEAKKFSSIVSLDLSCCYMIGFRSIEALGSNCRQLTSFTRNMFPFNIKSIGCDELEAIAIGNTMPKLTKLDISYYMLETEAVMAMIEDGHNLESLNLRNCLGLWMNEEYLEYIIEKCLNLESLDLRGCSGSSFDQKDVKLKFPKLKIFETNSFKIEEFDLDYWIDEEDM